MIVLLVAAAARVVLQVWNAPCCTKCTCAHTWFDPSDLPAFVPAAVALDMGASMEWIEEQIMDAAVAFGCGPGNGGAVCLSCTRYVGHCAGMNHQTAAELSLLQL